MSNYGEDDTPWADMAEDRKLHRHDAFRWTTYAERLQAAGVSWKVYQEYDNFGDNTMSFFPAFRSCTKDSDLYRRCRSWVSESKPEPDRTRSDGEQLVEAFRSDITAGRLPQISWIVTAADLSEHPKAVPAKGEHVTARLIEALVDHPDVFAQTVFILNYDEAGGFYDHAPQTVPPVGDYQLPRTRADTRNCPRRTTSSSVSRALKLVLSTAFRGRNHPPHRCRASALIGRCLMTSM
jgi:phospholipase C